MEKITDEDVMIIDGRPKSINVKVSKCQACGGAIHQYLNSVSQNKPWNIWMKQNTDDSRIPLMEAMIEMDKRFQDKLKKLWELKNKNEEDVRKLILSHCNEVTIEEGMNQQRSTKYLFKSNEKYEAYQKELNKLNDGFNKDNIAFIESEVEIEPVYCNKLPPFKLFPDVPELREPLKGFIL